MGKIRPLNEALIGKIAAGEVVERPAAAIKELIENSLDAGAGQITVELRPELTEYFRVSDDGCGIEPADVRMAFERHATSKISREPELDAIGTLGFRGEALASIAAVSRVEMRTRTDETETGLRVINEGGTITDIRETACQRGTTIIVRDLFYNTPVRRGFLKKGSAETLAVTETVVHLILSRPDVSFRLIAGGRTVFHSPGDGKLSSAVLTVFGTAALRQMREVRGTGAGMVLTGYVGIGELARSNRNGEYFCVNRRMMRSAALSAALENGCRERVMIGKFPMCVLNLELAPEAVNVNIHPNKLEVRLRNEGEVCAALTELVAESLRDRDALERPVPMKLERERPGEVPAPAENVLREAVRKLRDEGQVSVRLEKTVPPLPETGKGERPEPVPAEKPFAAEAAGTAAARTAQPLAEGKPAAADRVPAAWTAQPAGTETPAEPTGIPAAGIAQPAAEGIPAARTAAPAGERTAAEAAGIPAAQAAQTVAVPAEETALPQAPGTEETAEQTGMLPAIGDEPLRIFGALFDTYILIEYADHLLLVDQHAVHERLLFDRMMETFGQEHVGQETLIPLTMSVTRAEMALLEENRELLEGIGLRAEPFGETDIAIRSVPVILGETQPLELVRDILDELESGRTPTFEKKRAAILQSACKHAVKGGERLGEDQLRTLAEQMIRQKVTPTCPHGRPLVVSISHRELDRKFRRIQ